MLQNRSIALVIILGLVTCGIYPLYWLYQTATGLENEGKSGAGLEPVLLVIIAFFFPYVGYLLFGMAADQNLNAIKAQRGMPTADNKVMYMVLGFLIPIVLVALVQNEINQIVPADSTTK
ncbi:MAG: DUF4234 domain-containing protein [Clostridia bacterium]|nr:DUF4234 domain-containing protein [Clostridia bacterium]